MVTEVSKAKEKITTTKKVLLTVMIVWIASLLFCALCYVVKGSFPKSFMDSVNTVAVPTILSYAVRSGVDFVTRYTKGGNVTVENK